MPISKRSLNKEIEQLSRIIKELHSVTGEIRHNPLAKHLGSDDDAHNDYENAYWKIHEAIKFLKRRGECLDRTYCAVSGLDYEEERLKRVLSNTVKLSDIEAKAGPDWGIWEDR